MKIDTYSLPGMGRLDDYMKYFDTYREKYGSKTAVLYQQGKFHEIYGVDNDQEKLCNVSEIAELLGIKETRTKTDILRNSRSNPQMAGFNSVNLDERVDKLVSFGYTVVVVDQVPNTKPIQHKVSYIESPATTSKNNPNRDPFLVSVYLDYSYNKQYHRHYAYIGMSAIDLTTGKSYFYEANSNPSDPTSAEDDLTRFIQTFNPVELVLNNTSKAPWVTGESEGAIDELIQAWGFRGKNDVDHQHTSRPTVYTDTANSAKVKGIAFQEAFLSEHFPNTGQIGVLEYLDLVRYDVARISYIYLLNYCCEHNPRLLIGLPRPQLWGTGQSMILDTSSIVQLSINDSVDTTDSIVSFMSSVMQTPLGRRVIKYRILNPVCDDDVLRERYASIKHAQDTNLTLDFAKMRDIDRMHRRCTLGKLAPSELYTLDGAYQICERIANNLHQHINHNQDVPQTFHNLYAKLRTVHDIRKSYINIIDIEEAGKNTAIDQMSDSIFRLGWNGEIDRLSSTIRSCIRVREIFCQMFSDLVSKGSACCKYKEDLTGSECYCSMTKAQFKKMKANYPDNGLEFVVDGITYHVDWKDFTIDDRNKSNVKFTLNVLTNILRKYNNTLSKLRQLCIKLYLELLDTISSMHGDTMTSLAQAIGELDMIVSVANAAKTWSYCLPEICNSPGNSEGSDESNESNGSFLIADRLRHPLVERKHTYIPQNIALGIPDQCGMLLYGVNQTGKSCTMKSVGVAVILAQAGFPVPADRFRYRPYTLLTTRILGNDSIDRGLSTFAVEMIELRSILTRCNNRSLNLGDEVCHGTESASAVALVAASIRHMSRLNANFIFATHLHELSKMEEVTQLDNVKHYHLSIEFDGDRIVYNRLMKPGSGLGQYGIEVAKHLRLPQNVLDDAKTIRNKYFNDTKGIDSFHSSRYNSNVIVHKCLICGQRAKDTHHIMHQAEAQNNHIVGSHKNIKDNLVPLCQMHHDMVHGTPDPSTGKILVIFGYHTDGSLDYTFRKKLKALS